MNEVENIEHPTSNMQRSSCERRALHWMLSVECSMLNVEEAFP
jgi:hypothetical protein